MRLALVAAVVLVLAAPAAALAQPALTAPESATPAMQIVPEKYDPDVALGLSLGVTAAGIGAIVAANNNHGSEMLGTAGAAMVFFGPSTGHWYSGHVLTRGLGLRAAGLTAAFTGAMVAFSECPIFSDEPCNESATGPALVVLGGVLYVAGTVDDIVTAPGEARRRNRAAVQGLAITPTVTPHQAGFAISGQF